MGVVLLSESISFDAGAQEAIVDQAKVEAAAAEEVARAIGRRVETVPERSLADATALSERARAALALSDPERSDWTEHLAALKLLADDSDEALITVVENDDSADAGSLSLLEARTALLAQRVEATRGEIDAEDAALLKGQANVRSVLAGKRILLSLEQERLRKLMAVQHNITRRNEVLALLRVTWSQLSNGATHDSAVVYAQSLAVELERLVAAASREAGARRVLEKIQDELKKTEGEAAKGVSAALLETAALQTELADRLQRVLKKEAVELQTVQQARADAEVRTETLEAAKESDALYELRERYSQARKLFGKNHVLLTPIIYATRSEQRGGVAGIIGVPLLGVGGGYGWDFYPDVKTEEESAAFLRFERGVRMHRSVIGSFVKKTDVPATVRERRLELLIQTFKEMIAEDIAAETVWLFDRKEDLLRCVREIEASSASPEKKLEGLEELWMEYEHLRDYDAPRRADVLLGPNYGIPVTDEPTEIALLGAGIETHLGVVLLGSKWWAGSWWRRNSERLRFTVSGGFETRYGGKYAFQHEGWFFGVGLSGEFSDDLVNLITGASGAVSGL